MDNDFDGFVSKEDLTNFLHVHLKYEIKDLV